MSRWVEKSFKSNVLLLCKVQQYFNLHILKIDICSFQNIYNLVVKASFITVKIEFESEKFSKKHSTVLLELKMQNLIFLENLVDTII